MAMLLLLGSFGLNDFGVAVWRALIPQKSRARADGPAHLWHRNSAGPAQILCCWGGHINLLPPWNLGAPMFAQTLRLARGLLLLSHCLCLGCFVQVAPKRSSFADMLQNSSLRHGLALRWCGWVAGGDVSRLATICLNQAGENALVSRVGPVVFGMLMAESTARAGSWGRPLLAFLQ